MALGKKALETITETMFYVLMALRHSELYGTEVADWVARKTTGRIRLGPGTLYTILSRFEEEQVIRETAVEGRKRSYRITSRGLLLYEDELARLRQCVADGEEEV